MRSGANLEYSTQRVLCVLQLTLIEDLKYFTVPFPPAIARDTGGREEGTSFFTPKIF